jgi:formylglycine-generating enzyme required for sulfatase activity
MTFNSQPQGANFYVDNQLVGKTPLSTEILETGSAIRLELAGHKTHRQKVNVQAGSSTQHPIISMVVSDGLLYINSLPTGANVTINSQFLGTTPLETQLPPYKTYRLELFKQGYLKAVKSISLQPEQTSRVQAELTPDLGDVTINLLPADAEIQVDGESYGKGSRTLSLSTRSHQLTIQKTGYQSKSLNITPKANQAQSINVSLLTLEQAYWATKPPQIVTVAGSELKLFRPNQVFSLGAPRRQAGRRANEVQRLVSLYRPFYLGVTEVSNQQFRNWKQHNSTALRGQSLNMDNQPAVNLSWNEVALYCNWLSQQQGLPKFYQVIDNQVTGYNWESHGYRLPTEAEWAWAARVKKDGQTNTYNWDNNSYPPPDMSGNYADESGRGILSFFIANYKDGYPVSSPVGSYKANAKGLYNMGDNVSEWVNDFYDLQSNISKPIKDSKGPQKGNRHVIRGASWALSSRGELRLSYRDAGNHGRLDVGFRIARYVDKPMVQP